MPSPEVRLCTTLALAVGSLVVCAPACHDPPPGPPMSLGTVVTLTATASPPSAGTISIFEDVVPVGGDTRKAYTSPASAGCADGETLSWDVEVAPADGWVFDHWEGDCSSHLPYTTVDFPTCADRAIARKCMAVLVPDPAAAPADAGPDASSAMATGPTLSLQGAWQFSMDANQNSPAPTVALAGMSPNMVAVVYNGGDGSKCDCNAQHLVIPLGKSFDCSKATLDFDYGTSGSFGYTSTSSLSIRFCKGSCPTGGFYGGAQFLASEQTGHSNCAIPWANAFPGAPQLHEGRNTVPLGSLQSSVNGSCSGTFDTIDVHLQGYACFKGKDTGVATLQNLRVY
jgi:hypothetical protein